MRILSLCFLLACTGSTDDSEKSTDTTDTETTITDKECLTDNEDCAPGTCRGEGPDMLPGSDCLACHKAGGGEAPAWSAGGTVFSDKWGTEGMSGVTVRITDSTGKTEELTSSSTGNFYTRAALTPPLTAEVEVDGVVKSMASQVSTGACNSCHQCDGAAGGKLYAE